MVRRDWPQPVVADLSNAEVLLPSPRGEGQGEGKGSVETLVWDHPTSIASGILRLCDAFYRTAYVGKFGVILNPGAQARLYDAFHKFGHP